MGYDLTIEKKDGNQKISVDEWKSLVASDLGFKMLDEFSTELPDGEVLRFEAPDSAVWHPEMENVPFLFSHDSGSILVKNPDEATIRKMINVSEKLGAMVLGDDGEVYDKENPLGFPKELDGEIITKTGSRRWWEFWR